MTRSKFRGRGVRENEGCWSPCHLPGEEGEEGRETLGAALSSIWVCEAAHRWPIIVAPQDYRDGHVQIARLGHDVSTARLDRLADKT